MLIFFNHFKLLFIITMFISCSSKENNKQNNEELNSEEFDLISSEEEIIESEEISSDKISKSEYEFKGYIGSSLVNIKFTLNPDQTVKGVYQYDKYKTDIHIEGKYINCSDCGGEGTSCNHLELFESVDNKLSGSWYFECFDSYIYDYPNHGNSILSGIWVDDTSKHRIALIPSVSEKYLEPNSGFVFDSKEQADNFFEINKIHERKVEGKKFYIFAKNSENQYEKPLPIGIELGKIEGMEPTVFKLNKSNMFENEYEDAFSVFDLPVEKISSESYAVVLSQLSRFYITDGYYSINVSDLNEMGYYVLCEHSYLLNKNGNVLGFFPVIDSFKMYKKPTTKSEVSFTEADEDKGHLDILEIKNVNLEYWAKVRFNYYTNVPCSEEVREPKPSVEGWAKFYDNKDELTIRYYPGGC